MALSGARPMTRPARSHAPRLIDIGTIVSMLAARAEALAHELLPLGKREGAEWREAKRAQGGLGDSLSVHLFGDRAGVWFHGAAGKGGDALDLIAYVRHAGDRGQALRFARHWLGLDRGDAPPPATPVPTPPHARRDDQGAAKSKAAAYEIWLSAQERITGTPVDLYLRGRGIEITRLPRAPSSIRYHPQLWCGEARAHGPAMVALIVNARGKFIGVHRTWLAIEGGRVTKARLAAPKKVLGGFSGGFIPISRGAGDTKMGEAPQGSRIAIAEGIEDALTIACACPELRTIAAVSVGNFARVALPPAITEIVLAAQNDEAGSPAAIAVRSAIATWQAQGRRVLIAAPPAGCKDLNELAQRGIA